MLATCRDMCQILTLRTEGNSKIKLGGVWIATVAYLISISGSRIENLMKTDEHVD